MLPQDHSMAVKVTNAIKNFKDLLAGVDIQTCLAILDENIALKTKNQTLEEDALVRLKDIALLQNKLEELQGVCNEKKNLSAELDRVQEEREQDKRKTAGKEAELDKKLAVVQQELKAERVELQRLRAFSIELIPMSTNHRGEINSRLGKVVSSARAVAEDYFGVDLPPEILGDNSLWDSVKLHRAVKEVPLPSTNAPVSKEMRVAAFLAVLAHEMLSHIFQPTYLLKDTRDLGKVLDELNEREDGPDFDTHLRSVLLAASASAPKATSSATANRIKVVVHNVSDCIQVLIPEQRRGDFKAKLGELCTEACEQWKFIQKLGGRIEPDSEIIEQEVGSWKLLNPKPPPPPPGASSKPRPNGTSSTPNTGKKTPIPPATQAQITGASSLADAVVVLPAFYDKTSEYPETLVQGYVLTAAQIAEAKGEDKAQRHPRRDQRDKYRRQSTAGNGQENGKNSNSSFLSQKSGGGQKGA